MMMNFRFFHLPPIVIHSTIPTGGLSSEERRKKEERTSARGSHHQKALG